MSNQPSEKHWTERKGANWALGCLWALMVAAGITGMTLGWPFSDGSDWQAVWAFLTFLVAVIAAVIALAQLDAHQKAQRQLSRPYVVVDFFFKSVLLMIEVKNIGQTPARDVRLTWDVKPKALDDRRDAALHRVFVDGTIPFLAPARSIRCSIGHSGDYWDDDSLPKRFEVVADYWDLRGCLFGSDETMILDLGQWAGTSRDDDYQNMNWSQFKWQTEAQRKIATAVENMDSRLESLDDSAKVLGDGLRQIGIPACERTHGSRRRRWWSNY